MKTAESPRVSSWIESAERGTRIPIRVGKQSSAVRFSLLAARRLRLRI